MAGHPQDDAQWATNAAFASPGDSWDGDPTKVPPPAGLKAEGWEPTLVHPSEIENYIRNRVGQFIEYLRLVGVKNWRLLDAAASDGLFAIGYDASTGIYVISGDTGAATTLRSLDGGNNWILPSTPPAANTYETVASDGAGNWVLAGLFADCFESSDNGDTWTLRTIGATAIRDVVFEPISNGGSGFWVAVGVLAGDGKIFTSPDRVTWTLRHTSTGNDFFRVAIDGSGKAVAVAGGGVFATSSDMITWTDDATFTADTFTDVEFGAGPGLWMIVGDDASAATPFVATSTDGVTFIQTPLGGLPAVSSFREIASDGGHLWLGLNATTDQRLFASSDGGITWIEVTGAGGVRFLNTADPPGGNDLKRMEFFARKFWLVGEPGDVWDSLAL